MGQRLLVLDTDSTFIDKQRSTLEFSFDVDFTDSPDDAIRMLDGGNYAAIMISVEVAENRGYAVCASIRNRSSLPDLKIALISSKATKDDFARHSKLRVHADLYLFKPIETNALIAELKTIIPLKTSDLNSALDALMGVDIDEERIKNLNSLESAKKDTSLPVPPAIDELLGSLEPLKYSENNNGDTKTEPQDKTAWPPEAQQTNQKQKNDSIPAVLEVEEQKLHQENISNSQFSQSESNEQSNHSEHGSSEILTNGNLRNRMKEAIAEKQALLQQLENLTQEIAEKNLQAVAFLKSKEELLQELLNVEESRHRLELEFEARVESERNLLIARLDDHQDSGPALRKRISELEAACAEKTAKLEFLQKNHSEEIRRLTTDFDRQRQHLTSLIYKRQEEIHVALNALDEAKEVLAKLLVGNPAVEDGS